MTLAIEADGLGKRYSLGERDQYLALRDVIAGGARRMMRRDQQVEDTRFRWALADVSLEINSGEVVGILGRNGAGKSTLLKLISLITRPTEGWVAIDGRVGTLLEVGSGFHPELTGSENVYLNGAILGMHRNEIERNFDDIVDFSGVGAFLDTPVKRYSTGMYMRLAFAVAAHLDTEILLVDEVLAVGDAEFQRRCIGRMRDLAQSQGRTVLFVSHSDAAIRQLCSRCIWLDDGRVRADGPTGAVMPRYLDAQFDQSSLGSWIDVPDRTRAGSGEAVFSAIKLDVVGRPDATTVRPGEALDVRLRVDAETDVDCGSIAVHISTLTGIRVVSAGTGPEDPTTRISRGATEVQIRIDSLPLNPGRYTASLWMARPTGARRKFGLYDSVEEIVDLVVADGDDDSEEAEALVATTSRLTIGHHAATIGSDVT